MQLLECQTMTVSMLKGCNILLPQPQSLVSFRQRGFKCKGIAVV